MQIARIGFLKSEALQLASKVDLIKCILMQNEGKQASELGGSYRLDMCAVRAHSESRLTSEAHVHAFLAVLWLLVQAATTMRVSVAEIQRDLVRLRSCGELTVRWEEQSYCVQVLRRPGQQGQGSSGKEKEELDALVDELAEYLSRVESVQLRKVNIVGQALRLVAVPGIAHALQQDFASASADDTSDDAAAADDDAEDDAAEAKGKGGSAGKAAKGSSSKSASGKEAKSAAAAADKDDKDGEPVRPAALVRPQSTLHRLIGECGSQSSPPAAGPHLLVGLVQTIISAWRTTPSS